MTLKSPLGTLIVNIDNQNPFFPPLLALNPIPHQRKIVLIGSFATLLNSLIRHFSSTSYIFSELSYSLVHGILYRVCSDAALAVLIWLPLFIYFYFG